MYKHYDDMNASERAQYLVNTSVQDLQSTLGGRDIYDLDILRRARKICVRRGEKTKAKMLAAKIRKQEKEAESAQNSRA